MKSTFVVTEHSDCLELVSGFELVLIDLQCKHDIFITAPSTTLHRLSIWKNRHCFLKILVFDLRFAFRRFEIWIKI